MSDHLTPHAEYERRFLVTDPIQTLFEGVAHPQEIEQAYLWTEGGYAVRVRVIRNPSADDSDSSHAFLTLKGPREKPHDYMRYEVEQPIDLRHAEAIVALAEHVVTKSRYPIVAEGNTFEVDVFHGANEGLIIAEFEASAQAVARLRKPWFAAREITHESRYSNDELAVHPYQEWENYK